MKNTLRIFFSFTVIALGAFLYSCQKEAAGDAGGRGAVTVYLTDHDTPIFDSVFIDIQKLEVKLEDSVLTDGGWISLDIHPGIYNILRFRNGLDTLFANGSLPGNRLRKIRLTLGNQNSVMKNGQAFPLRIKDRDREVVANLDDTNFDIQPSGQVLFWIDFDAGNSIRTDNSGQGNSHGYELRPRIKIFSRNHSGRIEGRVLPLAADPIVMAIRGSDTATAIPDDHDGEFKIVGLSAGTYRLVIDGQNGYQDTIISTVIVRNREDAHVSAILLHQ